MFWIGVSIASATAGFVALFGVPTEEGRATTGINPIMFGDFSLIYASLSGVALHYFWNKNKWLASFSAISSILGVTAVYFSYTRGAWVVLPILSLLLLIPIKHKLNLTRLVSGFMFVLIVVVTMVAIPETGVLHTIERTFAAIQGYFSGQVNSSSGMRLEMWKASLDAWATSPVIGLGQGCYLEFVSQGAADNHYSKYISNFAHSHNDIFFTMASRGLVGLILFIGLFLVPAIYAFDLLQKKVASIQATSVLIVVVGYLCCGLTESLFIRSQAIGVFVGITSICLFYMSHSMQNEKTE